MSATWDEFEQMDLRVGVVTEVEEFPEARVPAYELTIDFGSAIGTKRSSAQATHCAKEELLAGFPSEVLVLGAYSAEHGVVLSKPDRGVERGSSIA